MPTSFSPYLLDDAMPQPYTLGEHIVASSSKLIAIDKLLKNILPTGERVLIFTVGSISCTIGLHIVLIIFLLAMD